jgi:hypothetical protein
LGSVQRLSNGNTLVGFGIAGEVHEVDDQGHARGRARLSTTDGLTTQAFYRALRLNSLFEYRER